MNNAKHILRFKQAYLGIVGTSGICGMYVGQKNALKEAIKEDVIYKRIIGKPKWLGNDDVKDFKTDPEVLISRFFNGFAGCMMGAFIVHNPFLWKHGLMSVYEAWKDE